MAVRVKERSVGALHRVAKRFQPLRRKLRSHFLFEIGGQSIAYCYIRKNACSAFKRMILDQLGYEGSWDDGIKALEPLASRNVAEAKSAVWRIYVYRDPFERAASLFRNKLIMREGSEGLIADFERVSKLQAEDATFEEFVGIYLAAGPNDPHTWPQASQLLPMSYNSVSTLSSLFDDMKAIIGEDLARRYFAKPANQSSASLYDEPSSGVPIRLLRERYESKAELPSTAALDQARVRATIARLYHDDYSLAPPR